MHLRYTPWLTIAVLAAFLALALPGAVAEEEGEDAGNFMQRALAKITLGPGQAASQVILFPLYMAEEPEEPGVVTFAQTSKVVYAEPDFPKRRYNVEVANGASKPVLLVGGLLIVGGHRDRMLVRDYIVGPASMMEVKTLPASASSESRKDATPFSLSNSLVMPYARKRAAFGAPNSLLLPVITHYKEFLNPGDTRKSIEAINQSTLLEQYCLPCHQSLANFTQPSDLGRVLGFIAVVRGRIQVLELFGSAKMLRSCFEQVLRSLTFAAAAIEIRAKQRGIPIPGKDDPEKTMEAATTAANELLERIRGARYREDEVSDGEVGEALLFRASNGTRGRAVGFDGALVHATVFPYDPFEHALYSATLNVPNAAIESDPSRQGLAELARRAEAGQRLTFAERRLLGRLRGGGNAARVVPGRGLGGGRRR